MAVVEFNRRFLAWTEYMRLSQAKAGEVVLKSPQTISAWCSSNETRARTPAFGDLVSLPAQTGLDLNWVTGASSGDMWSDVVRAARRKVRTAVTSINTGNTHTRCIEVIRLLQSNLTLAQQDWFMAGVLGLASSGQPTDENIALYKLFMDESTPPTRHAIRQAVQRLSEFTGLSLMWLQLGDEKYLGTRTDTDLEAWLGYIERAEAAGITVDEHHLHFETLERMIKDHRQYSR